VKKLTRLGEHSGMAQQLVKFTPCDAIASMVGVRASARFEGFVIESWSAPTSSRMTKRMLARFDSACAPRVVSAPSAARRINP